MLVFRFLSNWILLLLIPLYALLRAVCLQSHVNIYYPILILGYGYLGYLAYHTLQGVTFDVSYVVLSLLAHLGPLYLMHLAKYRPNASSVPVLVVLLCLYFGYLSTLGTDVTQVYLKDKQITSLREMKRRLHGSS
jgi:hypothetical protein